MAAPNGLPRRQGRLVVLPSLCARLEKATGKTPVGQPCHIVVETHANPLSTLLHVKLPLQRGASWLLFSASATLGRSACQFSFHALGSLQGSVHLCSVSLSWQLGVDCDAVLSSAVESPVRALAVVSSREHSRSRCRWQSLVVGC